MFLSSGPLGPTGISTMAVSLKADFRRMIWFLVEYRLWEPSEKEWTVRQQLVWSITQAGTLEAYVHRSCSCCALTLLSTSIYRKSGFYKAPSGYIDFALLLQMVC